MTPPCTERRRLPREAGTLGAPGCGCVAAIVALVIPVAMAVVAAIALAGDVPIAVLAVGLMLVANAGVWFALTERGGRRALGAGVHYPSDVVADMVLGAGWAAHVARCVREPKVQ